MDAINNIGKTAETGVMHVIQSDLLTTIQDDGRRQCGPFGLAEAGAMDKHALFWGNRLVGNASDSPALEILLGSCAFSFTAPAAIALTGAAVAVEINGKAFPCWAALQLYQGDHLNIGMARTGLRAYLSIAGGFHAPRFFGSCSTVVREHTGGIHGAPLNRGDRLKYTAQELPFNAMWRTPPRYIPDYEAILPLRFFPGYHYNEFEAESVRRLLQKTYTITSDADRMGYRLSGPPLKRKKTDILSIGVPCGGIQVPPAGEPVILLNDRQSTGGYPLLGVVCTRDIFRLAQRKPGDQVRFQCVQPKKLHLETANFYQFFRGNSAQIKNKKNAISTL